MRITYLFVGNKMRFKRESAFVYERHVYIY